MKKNNELEISIFRLVLIISIIFYGYRQYRVQLLVRHQVPENFKVVEKKCRLSRGGSFVKVKHKGIEYKVEYYGNKCYQIEVGGKIKLYYIKGQDFFYVPGSPIYERYLYGLLILLLMTFIPWNQLTRISTES